jgi:uncharacterized phiE125 gp8 family phage protein
MYSVLVAPPAVEPVALAEAKAQCRVLHNAEDSLIDGLIPAARQYAEEYTRRAFITQTWEVRLRAFPSGRIYLPRAPLLAVESIGYTDGAGAPQTVASFLQVAHPSRPYVAPAYGAEWPIARDVEDAVTVRFTAGYGPAPADVPRAIRQAILVLVADMYAHRESVTTGTIVAEMPTAKRLLSLFRLPAVPS